MRARTWSKDRSVTPRIYRKGSLVEVEIPITIEAAAPYISPPFGQAAFANAFAIHRSPHAARVDIEVANRDGGPIISVTLVNMTEEKQGRDTLLYEASLEARDIALEPFLLDDLPDSFRYDRSVSAWGINAGVEHEGNILRTVDYVRSDRLRPKYWDSTCGQSQI